MNWMRSTRCDTGDCVRVALTGAGAVHVADEHGGVIELRPTVWDDLRYDVGCGDDHPGPWIASRDCGTVEWVGMPPGAGTTPVILRFTAAEWAEFLAAVRRGEFSLEGLAA